MKFSLRFWKSSDDNFEERMYDKKIEHFQEVQHTEDSRYSEAQKKLLSRLDVDQKFKIAREHAINRELDDTEDG